MNNRYIGGKKDPMVFNFFEYPFQFNSIMNKNIQTLHALKYTIPTILNTQRLNIPIYMVNKMNYFIVER